MSDNFKGFTLFNDIEDPVLRNRNRAVVLANILETNTRNNKVTPRGVGLILGYFSLVPDVEKNEVKEKFDFFAQERGYVTH